VAEHKTRGWLLASAVFV